MAQARYSVKRVNRALEEIVAEMHANRRALIARIEAIANDPSGSSPTPTTREDARKLAKRRVKTRVTRAKSR